MSFLQSPAPILRKKKKRIAWCLHYHITIQPLMPFYSVCIPWGPVYSCWPTDEFQCPHRHLGCWKLMNPQGQWEQHSPNSSTSITISLWCVHILSLLTLSVLNVLAPFGDLVYYSQTKSNPVIHDNVHGLEGTYAKWKKPAQRPSFVEKEKRGGWWVSGEVTKG